MRRVAAATSAVLLLGLAPVPASAGPVTSPMAADAPVTLESVYAALGVTTRATDYVLAVDTSRSMAGSSYEAVETALQAFITSLPDTDHVDLISFDSSPSPLYSGPAGQAGAALEQVPPADGPRTDIGAALALAIQSLERPGASDNAAVLLFTDGVLNATDGRYATLDAPGWTDLAARAARLPAAPLHGFAFPLNNTSLGGNALKRILPDTVVWRQDSSQLPEYVAQIRRQTLALQAADLVADDLSRPLEITWAPVSPLLDQGEAQLTLQFRSTTRALPQEINGLKVTVDGFPATVTGVPARIRVDPGAQVNVPVVVRSEGGDADFRIGRTTRSLDGVLRVSGTRSTPWQPVLVSDLGLPPSLPAVAADQPITGSVASGLPYWVVGGVIAALLVTLLLIGVEWRRRRPVMHGRLIVESPDGERTTIPLDGRRTLPLDPTVTPALGNGTEGSVRGVKGEQNAVQLSYRPRNATAAFDRRCVPGQFTELGGVYFTYAEDDAGDGPDATADDREPDVRLIDLARREAELDLRSLEERQGRPIDPS